jgi:hypothetical protein
MGESQRTVLQFYEGFGQNDLVSATAVFAEEVQITDPGLGTVKGLTALNDYLQGLKGPSLTPQGHRARL